MTKPNFFIIGAPKCGTTAMHFYLNAHPEIFMSRKELHYFGSDMRSPIFVNDLQQYLSFFSDARDQKRIGEAAIWYLYSTRAAAEIKEFSPHAKVIAIIRNPADMIYSYHAQRLYNGNEDVSEFERALTLEEERRCGRGLPADPHPLHGLSYLELANYTEQLRRYFTVLGRENVMVIIFDDMAKRLDAVFEDTLRFLGVDPTVGIDPALKNDPCVVNTTRRVRNLRLRDFLKHPPTAVVEVGRLFVPAFVRHRIANTLQHYNVERGARRPLSTALRERLHDYYRHDVNELSKMLNRDLLALWKIA